MPTRRQFLTLSAISAGGLLLARSRFARAADHAATAWAPGPVNIIAFDDNGVELGPRQVAKVVKTDAEWKKLLDRGQYEVTRHADTEIPFTGIYAKNHEKGLYRCVCCANALYASDTKFESGTGWPSFWQPIAKQNIVIATDDSMGMSRDEVRCVQCDAHLGHVFDDGPKPTGLRYCMNSAAMRFIKHA